jgi:hypothetical protein
MAINLSPTLRRRRLGSELRKLREAQRVNATVVAKQIGTSQSKLSAVESGRRKLHPVELQRLLEHFQPPETKAEELRILHTQSDQLGWWEQYSDVLPDHIEILTGLEAGAQWVRQYADAWVPALLQTQDYARALVTAAAPYQLSADMPRLVEFRLQRQQRLTDPQFRYTVVIDEGALRRHVGGREVMHRQIRHLIETTHQASVEIHVLPFTAGEHPAQGQSFSILTFPEPEDPETVFFDAAAMSGFHERAPEIRRHTSAFAVAINKAHDLDHTRQLLHTIATDLAP